MNALNRFAPAVLSLLRIASAYMFMLHGTAKFFSFPVSMGGGSPLGIYLAAAILEVGGGLLLLLGLLTRPVAFILSGQMAVAYFMAHASQGNALFPIANGGESAALFSFLFLYFAAAGGGAWSLDNLLCKSRSQ
ncbi:DoxX family protein [Kingella sp. SNUBH-2017]|jgi:identified by metaGeneAnnotator|uniref:DoxX family protein n=1 Tax=Kingella pumchi TaxID=2779506 RepID=A0ABS9NPG4_9NEIS|nr:MULTISPECIES: DoxX family protein [Kingella]MCG6504575.1 DoxX family protein [Kingella pumchi]MDD2182676.1 DoxX family protein [Kingella sp. SNUBH-2017]